MHFALLFPIPCFVRIVIPILFDIGYEVSELMRITTPTLGQLSNALIDSQQQIDRHTRKHRDVDASMRTNSGGPIACSVTSTLDRKRGAHGGDSQIPQLIHRIGHSSACTFVCEQLTTGIAAFLSGPPHYRFVLSVII